MPNTLLKFQLPILFFGIFAIRNTANTSPIDHSFYFQIIIISYFEKTDFSRRQIRNCLFTNTEKRRTPPFGGASIDFGHIYVSGKPIHYLARIPIGSLTV
jgi:hypothetical protein